MKVRSRGWYQLRLTRLKTQDWSMQTENTTKALSERKSFSGTKGIVGGDPKQSVVEESVQGGDSAQRFNHHLIGRESGNYLTPDSNRRMNRHSPNVLQSVDDTTPDMFAPTQKQASSTPADLINTPLPSKAFRYSEEDSLLSPVCPSGRNDPRNLNV